MFLFTKIITKAWLKALLACLVILFLLVTVGDIINGFLRGWEAQRVLLEYILRLPFFMSKILPICCLLSTLFAINGLKSHSELIAMLAGGYNSRKIYLIIFNLSLLVAFFQFLNLGFIAPLANKSKRVELEKSSAEESKYLARNTIGNQGILWYKSKEYFSSFVAFDKKNNILKNLNIFYLNPRGLVESVFEAQQASFVGESLWRLENLKIYTDLANQNFPGVKRHKSLIVNLEETPKDFAKFESDITTLDIFNLYDLVQRLKTTGINYTEYSIMFYEKLADCLICIVFSLFPLMAIFNPNRRQSSFGKNILLTLCFTILYWGLFYGSLALGGMERLSPMVATMLIPFIFSVIIGNTYRRNRLLR